MKIKEFMNEVKNYITKIEGHGTIDINFKKNSAKLSIDEGERLIEGILLGRPYYDAPFVVSRICGVCPIAHNLASTIALEDALKIKPSELTTKLRDLMICAQIIQSHTLHLYFLALSDYLNIPSTLSLVNSNPKIFKDAIALKTASDHLADTVAGRNVHPITTTIGGFLKIPAKKQLEKVLQELSNSLDIATNSVKLFSSFKYPELRNPTRYIALANSHSYNMISKTVETSSSEKFNIRNYTKNIIEVVRLGCPSKYSTYKNQPFMLGALSRLSLHSQFLNPLAKKYFKKTITKLDSFPAYNSFHNNLSQSVEIVHFYEEAIKILKNLIKDKSYSDESPVKYKLRAGRGFGALEAPRGTLYQFYELDDKGNIKHCNIITPTAQSLTNLESDVQILLESTKNLPDKKRQKLVEMLIRAYDPCITCSVH